MNKKADLERLPEMRSITSQHNIKRCCRCNGSFGLVRHRYALNALDRKGQQRKLALSHSEQKPPTLIKKFSGGIFPRVVSWPRALAARYRRYLPIDCVAARSHAICSPAQRGCNSVPSGRCRKAPENALGDASVGRAIQVSSLGVSSASRHTCKELRQKVSLKSPTPGSFKWSDDIALFPDT
jgi:hypothetical protein